MKKLALLTIVFGLGAAALGEDLVDNPAYKQWAAYKPGAMVKLETVSNMVTGETKMTTKMTMTSTLKEITAEKAVVEMVIEATMGDNKLPAQTSKQDIPAKVAKTATMPTGMELKGEGDEEIQVAGKKYKCHWVQYAMKIEGMTMNMKVWTAKEVPGGAVRMVSTSETQGSKTESKTELVEFKAA